MVRAEVVTKSSGVVHDYRVDRGRIAALGTDSIVLRERDNTTVTVALAPDVSVIGAPKRQVGRGVLLGLRRGMFVQTLREGDQPAEQVRVLKR
jgi:hypothetical protein